MKKFYLGAAMFLVLLCIFSISKCKKEPEKPVASDESFTVLVGAEKFAAQNEILEVDERDLPGLEFTVDYLTTFADAVIAGEDIIGSVKGDKITTYQFWLKLVPATLPHTKTFFNVVKKGGKVKELYSSVGSLTPEERLAVGLRLKTKFKDLPLGEAEELASTLLEAALVNAKLAEEIRKLKK